MTPDCALCPRLCDFRAQNRRAFLADYYNNPVPSFGNITAPLLVVGLAPGLHGANRTGRPFTGDGAGDVLYGVLLALGFASGTYAKHADDGLTLHNVRITNAVRCVPPQNKPTTDEIAQCLPFLRDEISAMPHLQVIVTLGTVAHASVCKAFNKKPAAYRFAHGTVHEMAGVKVINCYHCSRYNVSTKRVSFSMVQDVFTHAQHLLT